ncbi:MAG: hypothetical protein ACJ8AT_29670 [Hyalangium sp.]|uniref:hypothetical protein n=1 Tax=Hyalangium sp. TaxID=2028555 RepID=UPI003899A577
MKALFALCEGSHEVALLQRLLVIGGFGTYKRAIKDYPAPLANFLKVRFGARTVDESGIRELQIAEPPSLAYAATKPNAEDLLLIFKLQGENQYAKGKELIAQWKNAMGAGRFLPSGPANLPNVRTIDRWDICFLIDADDKGPERKLQSIRDSYRDVLTVPDGLQHGGWAPRINSGEPSIGFFSMRAEGQLMGTLEDMLVGWVERSGHKAILNAAYSFLQQNAPGSCKFYGGTAAAGVASMAKRHKAALTCVGQYDSPGASLAVFLEQGGLLDDGQLLAEPACNTLLAFMQKGMAL